MQTIVVVSTPRTGSTLLCEALAQHPAILGCGEVFEFSESGRAYYHSAATGDRRAYPGPSRFPQYIAYLRAIADLEGKSAVSFKLMDYQEPLAWRMLEEAPEIPVLIARRENCLEALASNKASAASGLWHARNAADVEQARTFQVEISAEELLDWHNRTAALNARCDALRNPRLVVDFDVFTESFRSVMAEVFRFVGVDPYPVKTTQRRLHSRPISERVRNYVSLKWECHGTSLGRYF